MKKQKTIYLDEGLIRDAEKFLNGKDRSFTWLAEQAIRKFIKFKSKKE